MNLKKTLDSGAVLEVTLGSFAEGQKLLKCVMREIGEVDINLGIKGRASIKDVLGDIGDDAVNTIKNLAAKLVSSDAVEEALWPCMERATYNNKKINRDLFEDERIREDYLIVAKEVLWFNLSPFLKNLVSVFQGFPAKNTASQG